jgi:alanyl-tRNA synthetase
MITSADVRSKFLRFFAERGHTVVKSASLVPGNDPTLLFTNAGMVPFKDVFTGQEERPYRRATTAQKCLRVSGKHNDLEQVGPSPRHHTFFEMLGNFSFGDYFKREAIAFAWEFLTVELGMDPDRLYPTVYLDDDEAFALWQEVAGLPAERLTRLGAEDNFWSMGDTGPCGPDSEIMYDRGVAYCTCGRDDCSPANECERWLEIWNLVFMQFETLADGTVTPLPHPSIDTGLGLERLTSVLQGADNNYDTDVFLPIMRRARDVAGHTEEAMRANVTPYRVIADHSRSIAFLIADGIMPGNEGRAYVLRMIVRRAARFGKMLGIERPFLAETVQAVIDTMGHHYTELVDRQDFIRQVVTQEETRFLATLSVGLARLDDLAGRLRAAGQSTLPGDEAFRLYDTYGFPLEMTRDASAELGFTVDEDGFHRAMAAQKERARGAQRFAAATDEEAYRHLGLPATTFVGYDTCEAATRVVALLREGQPVEVAVAGDEVQIVLESTPFYAEAGGQVGDTGTICGESFSCEVLDTFRPLPEVIAHRGRLVEGTLRVGDAVTAALDEERRLDIARNHTATHLLHRALRQVLGPHAAQSGSLVTPERLRFDFTHLAPLAPEELRQVQEIVNAEVRANHPVATRETTYEAALKEGVVALFGERYGDRVRVVSVEGVSAELCGGTHLHATGEIGLCLITSEASVGSGLRRIEAVTGRGALRHVEGRFADLAAIGQALGARPGEEVERANSAAEELRDQRHTIADLQNKLAAASADTLLDSATTVADARLLAAQVDAPDVDALRGLGDRLRDRLGTAVVALGAVIDDKPLLVVTISQDLLARGLHAGKIAGEAARQMGGGGGGRPHMAQAGGKDVARLPQAIEAVRQIVASRLQS